MFLPLWILPVSPQIPSTETIAAQSSEFDSRREEQMPLNSQATAGFKHLEHQFSSGLNYCSDSQSVASVLCNYSQSRLLLLSRTAHKSPRCGQCVWVPVRALQHNGDLSTTKQDVFYLLMDDWQVCLKTKELNLSWQNSICITVPKQFTHSSASLNIWPSESRSNQGWTGSKSDLNWTTGYLIWVWLCQYQEKGLRSGFGKRTVETQDWIKPTWRCQSKTSAAKKNIFITTAELSCQITKLV